jgi:hypothetical protein
MSNKMDLDEFFAGYEQSRELFETLWRMVEAIGPAELQVTKSQVAFRRRKAFAWVWVPTKYLRGRSTAPLVLTFVWPSRDASLHWKQIVEPAPGRFTHHLELFSSQDLDDEVRDWLQRAWLKAEWKWKPGKRFSSG